jgi:hypothetical protein
MVNPSLIRSNKWMHKIGFIFVNYPLLWKFAQIIKVPKPGKPAHDVASYCPISLLPIPSKVFEKLLLKRLRSDVDLYHLIPGYQFGFQPGHSPVHAGASGC